LVITPLGLVIRRGDKDTLQRQFDKSATSYWQTRESAELGSSREKQF